MRNVKLWRPKVTHYIHLLPIALVLGGGGRVPNPKGARYVF